MTIDVLEVVLDGLVMADIWPLSGVRRTFLKRIVFSPRCGHGLARLR